MNAALLSSATDEWPTPPDLFETLDAEFGFTLDPCATPENAKCSRYFTEADDGLAQPWAAERVFCNPPYGRQIRRWVAKAWDEAQRGALVVLLIPARPDTSWWHDYCSKGEMRLLRGRVRFEGAEAPAPFPSAVVVFRPHPSPSVTRLVGKCDGCGAWLTGKRRDARTCSPRCRKRLSRRNRCQREGEDAS